IVYAAALLLGERAGGGRVALQLGDLAGFAATWSFFLMLRVFDEHKDYANDCRLYPERVLSRGLISLGQLKVVGALAIVVQLAVSLAHDGGVGAVTLRWLVVMSWSLLMLREFFVGRWLSRHLVVYAASHMIVTPLSILWIAQMGAGGAPLDRAVYAYAAMSFLFGFCFEIARKMKAPTEERADVDTYTRLFGVWSVAFTVSVLWSLATVVLGATLILSGVAATSPALWAGVVALALPAPLVLERFAHRPSPRAAKLAQGVVGLSMLAANTVLVAALLVRGGRP
ncbi:MAG: hypothetical protein ACXVDD_11510, partial [Polyangia bacterium]